MISEQILLFCQFLKFLSVVNSKVDQAGEESPTLIVSGIRVCGNLHSRLFLYPGQGQWIRQAILMFREGAAALWQHVGLPTSDGKSSSYRRADHPPSLTGRLNQRQARPSHTSMCLNGFCLRSVRTSAPSSDYIYSGCEYGPCHGEGVTSLQRYISIYLASFN